MAEDIGIGAGSCVCTHASAVISISSSKLNFGILIQYIIRGLNEGKYGIVQISIAALTHARSLLFSYSKFDEIFIVRFEQHSFLHSFTSDRLDLDSIHMAILFDSYRISMIQRWIWEANELAKIQFWFGVFDANSNLVLGNCDRWDMFGRIAEKYRGVLRSYR